MAPAKAPATEQPAAETVPAKDLPGAQPITGTAGHSEKSDQWFKIGLSNLEVAALKLAKEKVWASPGQLPPETPPIADCKACTDTMTATMRILVVGALAHFDALLPLLLKDAAYMRRENFSSVSVYWDKIIKTRFMAEIAAGC